MRALLVERGHAGEPSLEGMAVSATQAVNDHAETPISLYVKMGANIGFRKQSHCGRNPAAQSEPAEGQAPGPRRAATPPSRRGTLANKYHDRTAAPEARLAAGAAKRRQFEAPFYGPSNCRSCRKLGTRCRAILTTSRSMSAEITQGSVPASTSTSPQGPTIIE